MYSICTLKQLRSKTTDTIDWVVEGLLVARGTSIVGACPKCGKSVFCRQLCHCIVSGEPFLGHEVKRGAVLYISSQESGEDVRRHFDHLGTSEDAPLYIVCDVDFNSKTGVQDVQDCIDTIPDLKLVVFDMLIDLVDFKDSDAYSESHAALKALGPLARRNNLQLMVIHHLRKCRSDTITDNFMGNTAITGAFDQLIMLTENASGIREIQTKGRHGKPMPPTLLNWNEDRQAMFIGSSVAEFTKEVKASETERIAIQMLGIIAAKPGCTQDDFAAVIARDVNKQAALSWLLDAKSPMITRTRQGRKAFQYWIAPKDIATMPEQEVAA